MPTFNYRAKSNDGRDVNGTKDAESIGSLVQELRGQGLVVLDVQEQGKKAKKQKRSGGGGSAAAAVAAGGTPQAAPAKAGSKKRKKVTTRDLAILCRQLSTMLKAGLPIIDALETLGTETENLTLSEVLHDIRNGVEGGNSLSEAINNHPKTFPLMFRAMVEAGEASGSLVKIIGQLGEYLKRQDAMQKKIKSAMMYPKFVGGFFFLIVAGVLLFLVPQFEEVFKSLSTPCKYCYDIDAEYTIDGETARAMRYTHNDPEDGVPIGTGYRHFIQGQGSMPALIMPNGDIVPNPAAVEAGMPPEPVLCQQCEGAGETAPLPVMTQILLSSSRFVMGNILYVIAGVIVLFVLWSKWSKSEQGRNTLDKVGLKLPVFGPLSQKSSIARWCMTLSTLLSNGVSLDQSLDIVSRVAGNVVIEEATQQTRDMIVQGQGLATSMAVHPVFPQMVVKMISVGEESGAMAEMMGDIAEYYDEEVSAAVDGISSVIEPLMIIMLGGIVAVVVMAIYLPIFNMGKAVSAG